jgi:tRNA(Ile)-lysidine synthase
MVATQINRRTKPALLKRMVRTIREQRLFAPGHHLLVAVSGGPDSIALLSLLGRLAPSWRLTLTAVHFNYRLRGSESDEDEAFVTAFCREREIPLIVQRPALAKRRKISSLQALARDARYGAMKLIVREIGADRIVVGHTANDQAETVLMWMLRGAGLAGLAGMPFIREALIVRPLLSATRDEIVAYLKQEGLLYRQDSSNETGSYRRNRIRKELIPVMMQIAPATIQVLQRQADLLREDERYLETMADVLYATVVKRDPCGGQRLERQNFVSLPVAMQRRLIRLMLRTTEGERRSPSLPVVETVRRFFLSRAQRARLKLRHVELTRDRDGFMIDAAGQGPQEGVKISGTCTNLEVSLSIPSTTYWPRTKQHIHVQIMTRGEAEPFLKKPSSSRAVFDTDRFSGPLLLRNWQPGDRLYPCGMKGKSKKLQDLFTDWKVARSDRQAIPLLVAPEGILWVIGWRQDERFLVRASTSRCLLVTITESESEGAL